MALLNAIWPLLLVTGASVLIHRTFFAAKKPLIVFPVWIPIEIALTSLLLPSGGIGAKILYIHTFLQLHPSRTVH